MMIPGQIRIFLQVVATTIFAGMLFFPERDAFGQAAVKDSLQMKKNAIEQDIEYTTKLLEETQKVKISSMNELAVVNSKIDKREELIHTISAELIILENQMARNYSRLEDLNHELKELKDEYARMIYFAFKNRSAYDRLMFLFSSENFNQAYQRLKYFQQYSEFRKEQAAMILRKQAELEVKIAEIELQKTEKESLVDLKEKEIQHLDNEKVQKNTTLDGLRKKETDLRKNLREKETAARKLQEAIEAIIAEEIRKSAASKPTAKGTEFSLTPEEKLLSDNFSANYGKLPWPTERGVISGTFGEHPHPVLEGIKVKNNGIDILTNSGSQARAVFDGEVSRVIVVPKYNNVVIIRHGEFLSVYSNLDQVRVKMGDIVTTKQSIGIIITDESRSRTELHFELWKGKELLNPLEWIAK
jgi:septal ring factor EnvC (AmiA/AmiB activator)